MPTKYILRVTAGSSYNQATHVEVPVNTPNPVRIDHELMNIELSVRIKGYMGLPKNSPQTSPYFLVEPHATNDDRYSICFRFTPKPPRRPATPVAPSRPESRRVSVSGLTRSMSRQSRTSTISASRSNSVSTSISSTPAPTPAETSSSTVDQVAEVSEQPAGIPATDLQFGNDFAYPIRDRLPPGFNTAMGIVKWWIDPGLEGDAYSDTPHLYGPVLSSINVIHVGEGQFDKERGGLWFEEGGDDCGLEWRRNMSAPDTGRERMKWALREESKEAWVWEWGRTYGADFFNPYLDFSQFSLRLPGFSLPLMKYIDIGTEVRRSHHLRYVLRNRTTGDTYMVIVFTLHSYDDVDEDGTVNLEARDGTAAPSGPSPNERMYVRENGKFGDVPEGASEPKIGVDGTTKLQTSVQGGGSSYDDDGDDADVD